MPEVQDKLGMAKEWEETSVPAEPAAESEVKEFVREIDLGDGSGKQVFKGSTYEELIDRLAEAQTNASKKIRELSQERKKYEPEKHSSDWQELRPNHTADPAAYEPHELNKFRKLFQAETGLTPQEFLERENARRRVEAEAVAQSDFVRRHADEYSPTPQNAERIYRLLQSESLPISKKNLDWAFDQLREQLAARPVGQSEPQPKPQRQAEPAPASKTAGTQVSSPPSFLRPSLGGRGPDASGGEIDAAEVARIAQLPLAEQKARIEQLFRQSRTSR